MSILPARICTLEALPGRKRLSSYTFWQKLCKDVQRNQESIRNHPGNSETIDSWLKVLPTYWLWDQRQGSENRRNYPFLAVLGIRKPVWTVSLTSSLSSWLADFSEGPFYMCIKFYCFHGLFVLCLGIWHSIFRFFWGHWHTCPENKPLFTGRRHSWSAVASTASCEPAAISSPVRVNDSKWTCPWLNSSHWQNLHRLLLLLADCSGYHPPNPRSTSYSFISSVRRCAKTRMARQTATEAPSTNPHLSPTSRPPEFEAWCHPANCQRLHNFQLFMSLWLIWKNLPKSWWLTAIAAKANSYILNSFKQLLKIHWNSAEKKCVPSRLGRLLPSLLGVALRCFAICISTSLVGNCSALCGQWWRPFCWQDQR